MKKNLLLKIALIFLLVIACGLVVTFKKPTNADTSLVKNVLNINNYSYNNIFDMSLGLDLSGGSHLVFEADTSKLDSANKEQAIKSLKNVIEKRVNLFGLTESSVVDSQFEGKDRIIVELPGINDPKEASRSIGQTAQLTFMEIIETVEKNGATPSASLVETGLTGADLKRSLVVFDQNTGKPSVSFEVSDGSVQKFGEVTSKLISKRMIILLDQSIVTDAVVQEKLTTNGQISGNFTVDEANEMSDLLNSGALPVPIKLVEEKTIGATLGADSINKSVKAGIIGLFMVMLFMILLYGRYGFVADIALLIFGIITLAIYKIIPVTLTLPGIAGFLLSVGMAVDSNILIFERLKEEVKLKSLGQALEVSFGRAWDSIRDANVATLVTAFILANPLEWSFLHVSGPVRGFAITLALGIGISLFTGIVVSRNMLRLFVRE
jgi:preprotein translocase subunit SecD